MSLLQWIIIYIVFPVIFPLWAWPLYLGSLHWISLHPVWEKKNRSWCFCLPSSLIQYYYNIEFYTSPLPDCVWFECIMQWWSFFRQLIVWRDFTTAQSTNRDMIFECMLQIQWCVFVLIGKEFTSNILL